ncbi:chemerin-like receptor 1 [Tenrec ecaudatus]|uniref:chemerin-like receptor 1 n=1 Tax=Tenrec ecaudatus TaxID=94439 RepID=UPI003F5A991D
MEDEDYNTSLDAYDEEDFSSTVILEEMSPLLETNVVRIFLVAVYSTICFLGIVGNGLVIIITVFKMKKTMNTVWFLNLAVADFLFNVFLPLHIAYTALDYHWVFGKAMCKISNFLLIHNMYTSVFLLTAISFDRCISVMLPVWSQNHRSIKLAYSICIFIWVFAFLLSSPSLVFRDTVNQHGKISCFNNFSLSTPSPPQRFAFRQLNPWHTAVTITRFMYGFLMPILIITSCYLTIIHKLRSNRLAKTKRPFKIIVTIIVTFFLCWCPYHMLYLLELHYEAVPGSIFRLGLPLATAIAIANSCMNPILYVFMGQDFKKFKVILFSRLVNALSEDTGHSSYPSHRSFTKMSSLHERCSMNERETSTI